MLNEHFYKNSLKSKSTMKETTPGFHELKSLRLTEGSSDSARLNFVLAERIEVFTFLSQSLHLPLPVTVPEERKARMARTCKTISSRCIWDRGYGGIVNILVTGVMTGTNLGLGAMGSKSLKNTKYKSRNHFILNGWANDTNIYT